MSVVCMACKQNLTEDKEKPNELALQGYLSMLEVLCKGFQSLFLLLATPVFLALYRQNQKRDLSWSGSEGC